MWEGEYYFLVVCFQKILNFLTDYQSKTILDLMSANYLHVRMGAWGQEHGDGSMGMGAWQREQGDGSLGMETGDGLGMEAWDNFFLVVFAKKI